MNQYKVELKEIFRKEIMVCAENEAEAIEFVKKAYLRTNMLEHSYMDLDAVETKIVEKNTDNKCEELEEDNIIDEESRENIEETVEEMRENLDKIEDALDEDDIVYIYMLIEDLEDNIEDLKETVREIE